MVIFYSYVSHYQRVPAQFYSGPKLLVVGRHVPWELFAEAPFFWGGGRAVPKISGRHLQTNQATESNVMWQCVKTLYPFCSHQNSWDLWMVIPLKMVCIGIDPYPCLQHAYNMYHLVMTNSLPWKDPPWY